MGGPMMQKVILGAVVGLFADTGLEVHATILKSGVVVRFSGGAWGAETLFFNFGDTNAVERTLAHASGYIANQSASTFAEISEGGAA